MPAGFNKGQIEYIKTIANVNGHKTYKATHIGTQARTHLDGNTAVCDPYARYLMWCLGNKPVTNPTGDISATTDLVTEPNLTEFDVYDVAINSDQTVASEAERVTPECFLESVHVKLRHLVNLDNTVDVDSHKEFRLMVFRHKEKQHSSPQLSQNRSNPLYDMFHGAKNTKYGPKGYRLKMDDEGTINYTAHSGYDINFDKDAMLTDSINKEDYVVMKDCRYYLGREYGGKHIYEDRFFWDHEDPIATDARDLTKNDSDKNYCWYIMLLGVNNAVDASAAIDNMGYVTMRGNTYVTSG